MYIVVTIYGQRNLKFDNCAVRGLTAELSGRTLTPSESWLEHGNLPPILLTPGFHASRSYVAGDT